MTDARDINQHGGWYFAVVVPGHPPRRQHFKVYELGQAKARELVKQHAQLRLAETCEPIKQLNIRDFTDDNMQPGEVKRHG
jgi:hypothetical protein